MHAAERLVTLFGLESWAKASDKADELYLESKRVEKAKDGAWWYRGPQAILCVSFNGGPPLLVTVVPPTWTLLKDMRGGDWYWAVGPEEARRIKEQK